MEARQDVQHWRAISGAVITGIDTVLADDCELNVRQLDGIEDIKTVVQPKRIILDRQGVYHSTQNFSASRHRDGDGAISSGACRTGCATLAGTAFSRIIKATGSATSDLRCVGGSRSHFIYGILQQKLVDELISYVAPTLLGQSARTMFNAEFSRMAEQLRFKLRDVTRLGDDVRFRLIPFQETL